MPGRFINTPACTLPVPFNHGIEPALSCSWNLCWNRGCPWSGQVRKSRKKRRWQLCFALVQVQTEASWLEKVEGQFTLTHHCLLYWCSFPETTKWWSSLQALFVAINQVINRPVSRDIFMSLLLVLVQWWGCTIKGGGWTITSYVKKLPLHFNTLRSMNAICKVFVR